MAGFVDVERTALPKTAADETVEDVKAWPDRDQFFADAVEREVLAKKRRALSSAGALHALRNYPKPAQGDGGFSEPSAAQPIENRPRAAGRASPARGDHQGLQRAGFRRDPG
jgi:hypothetical protein